MVRLPLRAGRVGEKMNYMEDVVSYFDEVAPIWDEAVVRNAAKLRRIMTIAGVRPGDEVLDAGSGTGVLVPYIREKNSDGLITEMDVSPKMLNMARAKYHNDSRIRYLNEDIEKYSEGKEYDRILLYGILPHLADKAGTIVRLFRSNLKGNGSILVSHPYGRDKINLLHSHGDRRVADAFLPPMKELVSECSKNGLNVAFSEDTEQDYTLLFK